jgi:hypothetical protein
MKTIHTFLANVMISHDCQTLIASCDKIQKNILFMVLNSEAAAIKHVSGPARDRKYTLVAYSRLLADFC